MQNSSKDKQNKYLKYTLMTIATLIVFAIASIATVYFTEIYHGQFWSYLGSSDNRFHAMRIEGLAESIKHNQYFPWINMSFMDGFGYIVNTFYSDLMIYPAAIFRLMGFSMAKTFIAFYFLLNVLTFSTSFLSFLKVSKKYWNSLVFSFVYTLSTYRLHDLLYRHDVGELIVFVFLPIAFLGIYEVFYGKRQNWWYLTIGMTAIIYSHALSPVLVAIVIVLVALCQYKELRIHPKRILSLLYAAGTSLLLSLAYFLPMMEQMKHTDFVLSHSAISLSAGALELQDLIDASLNNVVTQPVIGLLMMTLAVIVFASYKKIDNPAVKNFSLLGAGLLVMSTRIFPWGILDKTPLKVLQYPWRLDIVISIMLAIFIAYDPLHILKGRLGKMGMILVVMLLTVSASSRLGHTADAINTYSQYNKLETYSIGAGQEYLPVGTSPLELKKMGHKPQVKAGKAKLSNFKQDWSTLTLDYKNAKKAKVDLPIIGYYGYQATTKGNTSAVTMDKSNNNLAQVELNGSGKLTVEYTQTSIQKYSKIISLLSLVVMVVWFVADKFGFKFKRKN
ncbi:cell surface protein precursor [Companilactobacillus tucceti DSM 20183]|uniref:Cell surface protein n=1 Tax=Companilactobacillus tucceti DSM 20183 TaxID=1423811 RepID=A0A0R1J5X0_9LACO|nr:hypothetical protein [Companilactobacillus tucceti]KRK64249.1 cell surface protein precursor [Companilactobacillus tucceti DSM 20183]